MFKIRQFTIESKHVLAHSLNESNHFKLNNIDEHLFLYSIIKYQIGVAYILLNTLSSNLDVYLRKLEEDYQLQTADNIEITSENKLIPLTIRAEEILKDSVLLSYKLKSKKINTGHLLISIFEDAYFQDYFRVSKLDMIEAIKTDF